MELDQPELEGQLLLNGARNCDNRAAVASLSLETTTSFMVHSTPVWTYLLLLSTTMRRLGDPILRDTTASSARWIGSSQYINKTAIHAINPTVSKGFSGILNI